MSGDIRVLIADDDPGARTLHSRFVAETPGFVVAGTADGGRAALARSQHGVDLILLDMRMPDISGVEVLHRLRTLGAASPDVLVVSSSNDHVTVRQALAAHVVGYLVKPFTQQALSERLSAYAASRRDRLATDRDAALAQGEIDQLLRTGGIRAVRSAAEPASVGLPKGLSETTLTRVVHMLDPTTARTVTEVMDAAELSRATARRYLDYLVTAGVVAVAHRYGKRGRPQVLYRLAP